jgi:hypothetical protein
MIDREMKSQYEVMISLDRVDSSGAQTSPLNLDALRLMAYSIKDRGVWYGFVVTASKFDQLNSGEKTVSEISFINGDDARFTFITGSSVLFGDGVRSKGVMSILKFL